MNVFNQEVTTEDIVEEILDAVDCAIELSPNDWEELKNYLRQRYR